MDRGEIQQALTGTPMSRADVFRALCDLGWEARDAGKMVQAGFGLFGGRERWVFERTLSMVPLALCPRRVALGEHAHGQLPDIAEDKYVELLMRRRDDAACTVLLVRAVTGMGKTNALKKLLVARSTGFMPTRARFVPRATHVGALMVASTVGEVRAMYQACMGSGMRCVFYRDLFEGERVVLGEMRDIALFTTFHSVPRLVELITGQRGAMEAYRQEALRTAMTLYRVDQAMMQLVSTWYECLSADLVVLDESSRVWSGIIGPLCNPGMVYDVLTAVMRNSDSALMMSANLDDASMYVAVREVGEQSCVLYWHFARRPRRCVVYYDVEHFVSVLTRHVYAAMGTAGPPVMLFGDNKRQLRRLGRSVAAHIPARMTLEISSPLGAEIVRRLAAGDKSDLAGKAFVTATGCLSAAVSIHGGVSAVFGYFNGICEQSDVQQMTARVRYTEEYRGDELVTTPFVVHVHVSVGENKKRRRGESQPEVESESDDELANETRDEALERYEHNAYTAGELRRFLVSVVGQRPFQQRINLGTTPDPITRKLAERYNELIAQGLPTLAHMCALEVNDALYHLRAEHFLSLVRGKEFRDAVETDFRMMGYRVEIGSPDAPVYAASGERKLAAAMRRVLMHRRMTNLEREEASEVFCAVRCAYRNEFGEGAEEGARRSLMNKLFRTLHWKGLPDDEEDAWATLRLFTRHDDNVEEAIRYVRVLEAVLSGDAYETSVRQQQYMGNHYYFDPRLREAHITKELWRAMRLASCGETPACSTTRAMCEYCTLTLDGPLSTASIIVPTMSTSVDGPVDSEPIRAFLREHWHTGNEYLRGLKPPRMQELLRHPVDLITWKDFMFIFGRLVAETTGLSWRSSFRASSAARFALLPSEVPRLRFYAEAIRLRLAIPESDHDHAPMCFPRSKLQRAYESMASRNGPFAPIAGVE